MLKTQYSELNKRCNNKYAKNSNQSTSCIFLVSSVVHVTSICF